METQRTNFAGTPESAKFELYQFSSATAASAREAADIARNIQAITSM